MPHLRMSSESTPTTCVPFGDTLFGIPNVSAMTVSLQQITPPPQHPQSMAQIEAEHASVINRMTGRIARRRFAVQQREISLQRRGSMQSALLVTAAPGPSTWRSRTERPPSERHRTSRERRPRLAGTRLERRQKREQLREALENSMHHGSDNPENLTNSAGEDMERLAEEQERQVQHQEQELPLVPSHEWHLEPQCDSLDGFAYQPPPRRLCTGNDTMIDAQPSRTAPTFSTVPHVGNMPAFGSILEEAARRAEVAVLERDMGDVSL